LAKFSYCVQFNENTGVAHLMFLQIEGKLVLTSLGTRSRVIFV
jgi:hypothetical protein